MNFQRTAKYFKKLRIPIFCLKNCQEMWGVGTCDLYINFSRTHSYANTRESGSNPLCEFQTDIKKFSVVFGNENLFVNTTTKGTFLGISAYLKFQYIPSCDFFCVVHRYRKINKGRRAVSCEANEGVDSDSKWLLHLSDVSRV